MKSAIWDHWRWAWWLAPFVAGVLIFYRDEFLPSNIQDIYQVGKIIPNWELESYVLLSLMILFVLFSWSSFKMHSNLQENIQNITTPKLSIIYDPNQENCFMAPNPNRNKHTGGENIEQRALIYIKNTSLIEPILNMEIYCKRIEVLRLSNDPFIIKLTQTKWPRDLAPGEDFRSGLVRSMIATDQEGQVCSREFQIQIPESGVFGQYLGNEFKMWVMVVGIPTAPFHATFQFGEKEGVFYCKQLKGATNG